MKKLFVQWKISSWFGRLKPWLTVLALFVILRYTGALSGASFLVQSAIFHTGALDAKPDELKKDDKDFDYDFQLKDLSGKTISGSDLKNKTLFLNLWATWCGPCKAEMPSIQKLYNAVDHDKIVFIMLSLDAADRDDKVVKFLQNQGYTFPVYRPFGQMLPPQLRVPSIPTTFVISPAGKIVAKKVGTANYDTPEFKKMLEDL